VQVVEQAGHVRRSFRTVVLEDAEVVMAVGQVIPPRIGRIWWNRRRDVQAEAVAPETDRALDVGGAHTNVDQNRAAHDFRGGR
jgi:hypothetical protein